MLLTSDLWNYSETYPVLIFSYYNFIQTYISFCLPQLISSSEVGDWKLNSFLLPNTLHSVNHPVMHFAFKQSVNSIPLSVFSVLVLVSVPAPNMRTWRNNHPWNIALKPILLSTLLTVGCLENMIPLEVTHCPQNKSKLFSVRDKTHLCWFTPTRSVSCSHLCTKGILSF